MLRAATSERLSVFSDGVFAVLIRVRENVQWAPTPARNSFEIVRCVPRWSESS
jgi:hypothetical protein